MLLQKLLQSIETTRLQRILWILSWMMFEEPSNEPKNKKWVTYFSADVNILFWLILLCYSDSFQNHLKEIDPCCAYLINLISKEWPYVKHIRKTSSRDVSSFVLFYTSNHRQTLLSTIIEEYISCFMQSFIPRIRIWKLSYRK